MYIESRVRKILENVQKMFWLIQSNPNVSSIDKIKTGEVQKETSALLTDVFDIGFENKGELERDKLFTEEQMNTRITALAFDIRNIFDIFSKLPVTAKSIITFVRPRTEHNLFKNKFNGYEGQILAELGNDEELFYLVQYDTGVYNILSEKTVKVAEV